MHWETVSQVHPGSSSTTGFAIAVSSAPGFRRRTERAFPPVAPVLLEEEEEEEEEEEAPGAVTVADRDAADDPAADEDDEKEDDEKEDDEDDPADIPSAPDRCH